MAQPQDALALGPIDEFPMAQSQDTLAIVPIDESQDPYALAAKIVRTVKKVTWQYRNSTDEYWKDMPANYSDFHEREFLADKYFMTYNCQYGKDKDKNYHYKVDLNNFEQLNINTGKIRRLRRCEERVPVDAPVEMET